MKRIKTSNLTGPALDWAVAKCMWPDAIGNTIPWHKDGSDYSPTTNWAHGGPIIERERIGLDFYEDKSYEGGGAWGAITNEGTVHALGPSPLIAAMRCYVAAKLGDVVDVPEELLA